jgi:hypothetical protein
MIEHLKEFNDLVDAKDTYRPGRGVPEPPDEDGITRCIQVMLARQCIYANQHGLGPSYRVLSTPQYQGFFRKYFAAMGLEFYHDSRSGLVALKVPGRAPRFDHQSHRLRKDETAVLLALRVAYEEAFQNKEFNELGRVELTTDQLYDKLSVIGRIEIDDTRLKEILDLVRRKGVIDLGERDPVERVTPFTILPGIEIVVPSTYIERVRNVAETMASAALPNTEIMQTGEPYFAVSETSESPVESNDSDFDNNVEDV